VLIYGEDTLILSMETRIDPPGNSPKNYPACWEYFREELQKTIHRPFAKPIIGRVWYIYNDYANFNTYFLLDAQISTEKIVICSYLLRLL
jgi:hypothetical protein